MNLSNALVGVVIIAGMFIFALFPIVICVIGCLLSGESKDKSTTPPNKDIWGAAGELPPRSPNKNIWG